jgi:hypothetical protein
MGKPYYLDKRKTKKELFSITKSPEERAGRQQARQARLELITM